VTITALEQTRNGDVTTLTATSDLAGTVFFHWYVDGAWVGRTTSGVRSFQLPAGEQARVDVQDTTDDGYDGVANAPTGYPARRALWWTRSPDNDVARYVVEEQINGGAWSTIGTVWAADDAWAYSFLTGRLTDLATYAWRVTPYDVAGNAGTALALGSERIVRTPDAPDFDVAFDDDTQLVTFSEAS
jgi:hypothetical protein